MATIAKKRLGIAEYIAACRGERFVNEVMWLSYFGPIWLHPEMGREHFIRINKSHRCIIPDRTV
jgi:hypothetical protein